VAVAVCGTESRVGREQRRFRLGEASELGEADAERSLCRGDQPVPGGQRTASQRQAVAQQRLGLFRPAEVDQTERHHLLGRRHDRM
jgi:hypothetical protein